MSPQCLWGTWWAPDAPRRDHPGLARHRGVLVHGNRIQRNPGGARSPERVPPRPRGGPPLTAPLRTYCEEVLGLTVESLTGLPEFMEGALENRLGSWDDRYTARAVVNYIREGFGLGPV